ncbi:MAG: penicillin acylase family protein [Cytophagales bacterium]|nr:penicillin acylase family protein [Cytophagales bacterium]
MRTTKIILSLVVTLGLTITLNTKLGQIPPLGKFLSPFQGFWQNAENEKLDIPESLELEGLKGSVKVHFDDMLIPHIYAENEHDLYMVQGYITAYHRLWQMEFQQLATAGRISEILGESALNFDRTTRRSGMAFGATRSEELMKKEEPETYAHVVAYAEGVNAYIETVSYKDYPIEYKLLDYSPEEWTAYKTFLQLKQMANDLSRGERDLEHTNALKLWGPELFDLLYPERYPDLDPVIPAGTKWEFQPKVPNQPTGTYPLLATRGEISKPDPHYGSNSFVVNGSKTANGKTLLANEPDLGLNLPSIWYVAHLNSPEVNVMGSTLPGSPGVVLGFNDSIAWGFTNAKRDLVDWYAIEFKDASREEYKYDNKWLKTKKVIEEIKIKGGETYYDTIIYTHYGPIAYDQNFTKDKEPVNLAMRWTAHDASKEIVALNRMNKAKNYDDYVEAFSYYTGPPQNMSFASTTGDIAIWINGKFPVKWEGQGKFLLDGSNMSHEWSEYMPREHLYHVKNPKQNFVSSANQHPGDSTYPYYDYDYNFEYYRNRRINDRLRTLNNIEVKDMIMLQNDNFNYIASESLPMMLASIDTSSLSENEQNFYDQLSEWGFFNEADLKEPSMYELWGDLLYSKIWDEFEDKELALYTPSIYNTIHLMVNKPEFEFFDYQATSVTETAEDLMRITFKETIDSLRNWKDENGDYAWYRYKNTNIRHLLRIPAFSKSEVHIGGNNHIVNAASGRAGPSWRFVVELGDDKVQAWGIYPGSQTGNPGNPSYAEFIDRWANQKYEKLLFEKDTETSDRIIFTQTLTPSK